MSDPTYQIDSYLRRATSVVTGHSKEGGIVLDRTIFYPLSGGQPGDSGRLNWGENTLPIATTIKGRDQGEAREIVLIPGAPKGLPPLGTTVEQVLDWDRRLAHMRCHTALHLLSVALKFPVSGGAVGAGKGRLDFNMGDRPIDKATLTLELNRLIMLNLPVTPSWITDAQLRADPGLVKTMSVAPPMGQGRIRLIGIGNGAARIDLQPCGGTHVAATGEIGEVTIGKVMKKGRHNRRVYLHLSQ